MKVAFIYPVAHHFYEFGEMAESAKIKKWVKNK